MAINNTLWTNEDDIHMRSALHMAGRGVGRTWPNPSVGCVIVKNGVVIARAVTAPGGRPHAETQALSIAGASARGACVYVTLEPCSHTGKTPPCTDALITAGVARVVIALHDPDPRVNGQGVSALINAGVEVVTGCLKEEAEKLYEGYILNRASGRPAVTLKIAASLDGKIALKDGTSQWITGDIARRYGHLERTRHDGILTGSGTVAADDPLLLPRIGGIAHTPVRIVMDTRLSLPLHSQLVQSASSDAPVWILYNREESGEVAALRDKGVDCFSMPMDRNGKIDLPTALGFLAEKGLTSVMVEAGPALSTSFLQAGLVDTILWFQAPALIGGDGRDAVSPLSFEDMNSIYRFRCVGAKVLGADRLSVLRREKDKGR